MNRKLAAVSAKLTLCSFSTLLSLIIVDRGMGISGLPSRFVILTHPPNYEKRVSNIEGDYLFRTNSQGLRSRETPFGKPPGTLRLFVSGDSFTEGELIPDGNRFADLLEGRFDSPLRPVEFINGGVTGTGPMTYVGLFRKVGVKFAPDRWLIVVFPNDLTDTPSKIERVEDGVYREFRISGLSESIANSVCPHLMTQLRTYLYHRDRSVRSETGDLVAETWKVAAMRGVATDRFERWRSAIPEKLIVAANQGKFNPHTLTQSLLQPEIWTDSIDLESDEAKARAANMARILGESLQWAVDSGIAPAVVFLPFRLMYDTEAFQRDDPWILGGATVRKEWLNGQTRIQAEMAKLTASTGVPFLDLTETFRELPPAEAAAMTFRYDFHLNQRGHEFVADRIGSWLQEIDFMPVAMDRPSSP